MVGEAAEVAAQVGGQPEPPGLLGRRPQDLALKGRDQSEKGDVVAAGAVAVALAVVDVVVAAAQVNGS